jgi:Protein of unknown function (DUF3102)
MHDLTLSNSLVDLAARIRAEHEAAGGALKRSLQHAIAAGELLLEAKAQLKHGQWLPWLSEHCELSERSAQLYIRIAKNRTTIEEQMRNGVADLTMNQAAALMVMSSDMRKLFAFIKQLDERKDDPEEVLALCMEAGIPVIHTPNYDPFAGCDDAGKREWCLFALFLVREHGWHVKGAAGHVEWVCRRPFESPTEWFGGEGTSFRKTWGMRQPHPDFLSSWSAFREGHQKLQLLEIDEQLKPYWDLPEPAPRNRKRKRARAL